MDMLYMLLQKRCDEIKAEGEKPEGISKVEEAFNKVIDFSNEARIGGLLGLEELAEKLDKSDIAQKLFYNQLQLIIDGADPAMVKELGINSLISSGLEAYDGLAALIYFRGSLMIQMGDNTRVIQEMLKSMIPEGIKKGIEEA